MSADEITLDEWRKRHPPLKTGRSSKLLTVADAAEVLGVSRQAVHKAIAAGSIESYRIVADHTKSRLLAVMVSEASVLDYQRIRNMTGRTTS